MLHRKEHAHWPRNTKLYGKYNTEKLLIKCFPNIVLVCVMSSIMHLAKCKLKTELVPGERQNFVHGWNGENELFGLSL